jgi:predicted phage terminase large subunit-like protein
LLHVLREKLEYPELKKRLVAHAVAYDASTVLIENKNAGQPLLQELKQIPCLYVVACDPEKDKETRMYTETPQIECGDVVIPKEAPWLADFRAEVCAFPKAKHDDQVDSLSQYLFWVRELESRVVPRLWRLD